MTELIEGELTRRIIGCAMAVHNEIGPGLREKTYERALCVELREQGMSFSQQATFPVLYRGEAVDEFIPDLLVEGRVVVDAKTVPEITETERGQMLCYLRITGAKVGMIINFRNRKLEWERIVLDTGRI
jgi:GxxExxY protein